MIPIQLYLRNFLSYGEGVEPLDFTPFKLACLSGRNGHGKSALLDAITWAVWGEARKAGFSRTPDADLLRLSADEMEVEFTFLLNKHEYQVYRNYRRGKRAGKLEFRVRQNHDSDFRVLTGSSKRETQQRIIETIGLDYKTFINSSFLQQGKADEFTRQSPSDRKEILGNILGLGFYDRLLEETKQRLSTTRAERRNLEDILKDIEQELSKESEIQEEEKQLNESIQAKESQLETLFVEEKNLRGQITDLHIVRERIESLNSEEKNLRQRIEEISNSIGKIEREQKEQKELVEKEEETKQKYDRYNQINEEMKRLIEVEAEYNKLEKHRQELERTIEAQRAQLREELASQKSEYTQLQKGLETAQQIISQKEAIEKNYAEFKEIAREDQNLESLRPRFEELSQTLQQQEKEIEKEKQSIQHRIAELRGYTQRLETVKHDAEKTQQKIRKLPILEKELAELNEKLKTCEERGQEISRRIDQEQAECKRLSQLIQENEEKISLLQRGETRECFVCKSPLNETGKKELVNTYQTEIQRSKTESAKLDNQIKKDEAQIKSMRSEYKQCREKVTEKENELTKIRMEQQSLQQRLEEQKQLENMQQEIQKLTEILETEKYALPTRQEITQTQKEIESLQYNPEQHKAIQTKLQSKRKDETMWERLQEELKKEKEYQSRSEIVSRRITEIEQVLEKQDFAHSERQEMNTLIESIKPLAGELAKRKPLHDEQHALRNIPAQWNRIQYAKERIPILENDWKDNQNRLQQSQTRLADLSKQKQDMLPKLNQLESLEKQLEQKETTRESVQSERDQLNLRLGGIREKLKRLEQRKQEQEEKRSHLTTLFQDERLYDILKNAFSRDGIPAMIVEQSLPELEEDANRILHQLTDGQCSVNLDSQREKKSGGIVETLDIKISDEMGTRDYEMFSGGEAFRADLALRIALSQLLCRRAGSRLQLLVIDEGFGSQDPEGLNAIVEAINDIQEEFEKILVVTHLDELKDKFLTRIEVHKEAGIGSRYNIVYT